MGGYCHCTRDNRGAYTTDTKETCSGYRVGWQRIWAYRRAVARVTDLG